MTRLTAFTTSLLTAAALFFGSAFAQTLQPLLPADAFFVLGTQNAAEVWDDTEDFRAEFGRLGVAEALERAFAAQDTDMDFDLEDDLMDFDLELLDLIGREAWLSVSASPFSPLPAVTLLARLDSGAQARLAEAIDQHNADAEVMRLSEGDYEFFVVTLEDDDLPFSVLAFGQADDLAFLSSNPDTLRGVLRRLGGASEAGFGTSGAYENTLGRLGEANFYAYMDYGALARVVQPFGMGLGFDGAIRRLSQALETAGATGGVARVTPEGVETEGFHWVNPGGGDASLQRLLTEGDAAADTLRFAPATTLGYSSMHVDVRGWWAYINEVARSVPELGGDLNSLIQSFTGLNLNQSIFSWTGEQVTTITTGFGDVTQPGIPSANLLGEQVFMIATSDEAAAQSNLEEMFQVIAFTLAAFTDPMGRAIPQARVSEVGGVSVTSYRISDGISLAHAVTDGYALIATSEGAMNAVLGARESGVTLDAALFDTVPEGASSVSYTDNEASAIALAGQLSSNLQLMAGLAGSAAIDFDAIVDASLAVERYMLFVASRLGAGMGYSQTRPEGTYSYSFIPVDW